MSFRKPPPKVSPDPIVYAHRDPMMANASNGKDSPVKVILIAVAIALVIGSLIVRLGSMRPLQPHEYPATIEGIAEPVYRRMMNLDEGEGRIEFVDFDDIEQLPGVIPPEFRQKVTYTVEIQKEIGNGSQGGTEKIPVEIIFEMNRKEVLRSQSLSPFVREMEPVDKSYN